MRLSNDHPTLVVLESALGGLHGDNGAAAIGSAVGCRGHYSCTSRNVNACLQRLELHRRATHATLCRLQRWKMGRGGSRASSCWSVASQFTATWPCVQRAEPAKLSLLADALLAKEHSACSATEQGCAMPPLLCKKAVHSQCRDVHWSEIRGMSTFNGSSAPSLSVGTSALQRWIPTMLATIDRHE